MSPLDKSKVADLLINTIEEFKKINRTDFEYQESVDIFNAMKWNTIFFVERDANRLLDGKDSSYLSENCYFQIQQSMSRIKSALGLQMINIE